MNNQKKIKILYIINNLQVGGAEKILLELVKNIDKKKFEIKVATIMGGGELERAYAEHTEVKIFKKSNKLGLNVLFGLRKLIRQYKPDIIHTHLFSADVWGRIAAMGVVPAKIISTEHNMGYEEGRWKKALKHFLSYFNDVIVAVSEGVRDYLIIGQRIEKTRVKVIYNGIDLEKFLFRGTQLARYGEGVLRIVTIGRLVPAKAQETLIEAMYQLADEYPQATLQIIGTGPRIQELGDIVKKLHLEKSIEFVGSVANTANYLNKADLFILPSVLEGLGMAAVEAMAIGVPVIATNIPGLNEVVINEETGLLFEPLDSQGLVGQIKRLLKDTKLQERMILNGRDRVEKMFSVEQMIREYEELYEHLTSNIKHRTS